MKLNHSRRVEHSLDTQHASREAAFRRILSSRDMQYNLPDLSNLIDRTDNERLRHIFRESRLETYKNYRPSDFARIDFTPPSGIPHLPSLINRELLSIMEPILPVEALVRILPCNCRKAEKTSLKALKIAALAAAGTLAISVPVYLAFSFKIALVASAVSLVALTTIGGIAAFEFVRRKEILPSPAQKVANNVHAFVIRSICTLMTAIEEKNRHLVAIFGRKNHYCQFQH